MALLSNHNRTAFTETEMTSLRGHINGIAMIMTAHAVPLTEDERASLNEIKEENAAFVNEGIAQMASDSAAAFLPAYIRRSDVQTDMTKWNQMLELFGLLTPMLANMIDIRAVAGSEAYKAILLLKSLAEAAAKAGVPGAEAVAAVLRVRFSEQGGRPPVEGPQG